MIACYLQNKITVGKKNWALLPQLYAYEKVIAMVL
jgi:hypothetical protein